MSARPAVKFQGKTIVEWGNGDFLAMFPDGVVKSFATREAARKAATAFYRHAHEDSAAEPAIGLGMIEWREVRA